MILRFLKSGYKKLKGILAKTGSLLGTKIRSLFQGGINEETLEQLEQLLYEADLGVETAMELTEKVRQLHRKQPYVNVEDLVAVVQKEITEILLQNPAAFKEIPESEEPMVIMIVGVNGNGKTTSVAKLANHLKSAGNKVLIAAADTFRAAAIEQLDIWAQRIGVEIVRGAPNSDPAAVAFDAVTAGKARGSNAIIIDTAGRLHTRSDLMQELEKIRRSCAKVHPNSPHATLLVLDATTGQNAIDQAKIFHQYTPISGLILTKLDGTSKGGVVVNIQRQLGIPVKFIGLGEGLEDLEPFEPESFASALFE